MKKIQMLTQDRCPKCIVLETFLFEGLGNDFHSQIEMVTREDHETLFMKLVKKHGIQSTPALVCEKAILHNATPSNVMDFIVKNL